MSVPGSHLLGGRINMILIREAARAELRDILGKQSTKKVIVWDESLIGPIGLIAEVQFLIQLGVFKMTRLPIERISDLEQYKDVQEFVFLVRPQLSLVESIVSAIGRPSKPKTFTIVFVPRISPHCVNKFAEYRLQSGMSSSTISFNIKEFHLDMLPLDQDLITLDIDTAFNDLYLDEDPTPLHQTARSIGRLQALYGTIPTIHAKGRHSKIVADLLERTRQELLHAGELSNKDAVPQIDAVILLDRSIDFISALSTQLTYEGLIDEFFDIKYNSAKFPRDMFSEDVQQLPKNSPPPNTPLQVTLNSEENMYLHLRDLNFRAVGSHLSKQAREISAAFEERHDAKTVQQLKQFVQKLPHMQQEKISLSRHTTIAELIKQRTDLPEFLRVLYAEQGLREEDNSDMSDDYIEECMGKQEPIHKVLRLICLQSIANNGLKPKLLDRYKTGIIQCYGAQNLISLHNLEKAGFLKVQDGKNNFLFVKKKLDLIVGRIDEKAPKDIAYVFSGYAPATVRLVEYVDKPNEWSQIEEVMKYIPGPTIKRTQPMSKGHEKKRKPTTDQPQVVLVFFIGGVSYAEIAALRYLASRDEAVTDYIIGTTHISTGRKTIESILEETPHYDLTSASTSSPQNQRK